MLVELEHVNMLNALIIEFLEWSLELADQTTEQGKELIAMLEGTITTYLPIYLGDYHLLFWSGRYWEESHPIPLGKSASTDFISYDIDANEKRLFVKVFV